VIHDDPLFEYGYYLGAESPCIDAGGDTSATIGLNSHYAQASAMDSGTVDMGYQYVGGYTCSKPDLYVNVTTGSDANGGESAGDAYKTITKALREAVVGTRINVATGAYNTANETFPLTNSVGMVKILGANPEGVVIDADDTDRVFLFNQVVAGSIVSNVTMSGGFGSGKNGGGLYALQSTLSVVDCIVENNQTTGGETGGAGIGFKGGSMFVKRSMIRNNEVYRYAGGIRSLAGNLNLIERFQS